MTNLFLDLEMVSRKKMFFLPKLFQLTILISVLQIEKLQRNICILEELS